MLRVGLTGGIGCGKSTVAAMMRELGCHILDADDLAHRLIEPGQAAYDDIVREFGREILGPAERVDRAKLGAIVFADAARRAKLESFIHPRIFEARAQELRRLEEADPQGVAVIEAALLVEAGYYKQLDRLIVVWCRPDQQLTRLTDPAFGRGMTGEQARRRIAAQFSLTEKRKLADDEIDASGTVEETRRQVVALVEKLKRLAAAG
jgi:dephospho-CoA kinase